MSVIISTRGRPGPLALLLLALTFQRQSGFEVVVVFDPADTATAASLAAYPAIRPVHCVTANLALSRNLGAAAAAGDILAFIDDDAVPEPDWLSRLAAAFADPGITAAGGFIRDRTGVKFQYRYVIADRFGGAALRHWRPRHLRRGEFLTLTGTNFAIRAGTLRGLGGFDENFRYFLEETDLLRRMLNAGGKIAVVPAAEVHHAQAASDLRDNHGVPRSLYLIARSKAYFCAKHGGGGEPALRRFASRKARQIDRHRRAGRIDPAAAARLHGELAAGLAEGSVLPPPPAAAMAAPAQAVLPFNGSRAAPRRLAVVCTDPGAVSPLLQTLRQGGDEITLIFPGAARRVSFDGIWRHQLPRHWWRGFAAAARAEIARTRGRRNYDVVLPDTAALERFLQSFSRTDSMGYKV